jgi:O-antigen ligase
LAYTTPAAWTAGRRRIALGLAGLAIAFLADIVFIIASRTALAAIPMLMVLLGTRYFGLKRIAGIVAAGAVLWEARWVSSPYLRTRVEAIADEVSLYRTTDAQTSSAAPRVLAQALGFVDEARLFGQAPGRSRPRSHVLPPPAAEPPRSSQRIRTSRSGGRHPAGNGGRLPPSWHCGSRIC